MGGKIRVIKDVGGGLRGSTSGLRFNPREAPEFAEEDRNLGRDDPEGRHRFEEKRRREKETRHKKIAGLHHINLKVPRKKRAQGDNQRNDERLSEMTGPVSSTGYPADVASGAKTGGGTVMGGPNIMTGEVFIPSIDTLLKRDLARTDAGVRTIENHLKMERHKKSREQRKQMGGDVFRERHRAKKQLNVHGSRNQKRQTIVRHGVSKRTGTTKGMPKTKSLTNARHRSGKNLLWMQNNPMIRMARAMRGQVSRAAATFLPYGIPTPFGAGGSLGKTSNNTFKSLKKMFKRDPALHPVPMLRGPKQSSIPGGQAKSPGLVQGLTQAFSGIGDSILNPNPQMSLSIVSELHNEYLLEDIMLKKLPTLSHADLAEFKQLVRDLRRLLRYGPFRKAGLEDAEHDDERPTPNAHRKTTSAPTGATSVDPDDDPRFWGAHPMGLLLPRRGHM